MSFHILWIPVLLANTWALFQCSFVAIPDRKSLSLVLTMPLQTIEYGEIDFLWFIGRPKTSHLFLFEFSMAIPSWINGRPTMATKYSCYRFSVLSEEMN